jgi:signal transduction histidine kinase
VLIQTPEELVRRWPHLAGAQAKSGDAAIAAVPLLLGQRVLGVLYVAFRSPRRFAPEEVALLEALGRQCAQALDRAQLYAAERAARAAAEEALTLRDGFLSIASHELRTPLTSLLMQTQLLQRRVARGGLLPEREQGALAVVVAQAKRLDRLIAALLDVSRIERGQLTIEVEAVDIGALARRVVAEVQPTSEQHAIACATPASALVISGDPLRLEQVLQNLLQNALKYSPDGGAVDVSVAADGPAAVVEVADRGIGFPPEVLPQLFTRFYRAPNADARNVSGLGIGLYVVREIVRLHGGTVAAALRPDGGSRFTVRLPLATDAPAGDPEIVRGGGADG